LTCQGELEEIAYLVHILHFEVVSANVLLLCIRVYANHLFSAHPVLLHNRSHPLVKLFYLLFLPLFAFLFWVHHTIAAMIGLPLNSHSSRYHIPWKYVLVSWVNVLVNIYLCILKLQNTNCCIQILFLLLI
jgi:hypothetical protein